MPSKPNITRAVRAIMADAARRMPEFAHVKPTRVLVVAGEARRASWATIRPLGRPSPSRPVVRVKGRQMLYVVTLRPRFFRVAGPEKRVETILHEMFHISRRFDGTLHHGRRHVRATGFGQRLDPLVRRYLDAMPAELYAAIAYNGVALARQWLERPGPTLRKRTGRIGRRVYSEKHLFLGPIQVITKTKKQA